ncbi:enoyl-CoA hydratase-related protein [Arhodomonas sp. AD133]|uniref:enoyl-CoA hydratase-related protein n=1 Tax=Arhodomonas sp. AD133 TaxID=3415009 RepID=UPI003EB74C28
MSEHVREQTSAGVRTLTLDRPEKKNALTQAMYAALAGAVDRAGRDPAVAVLRFRGEGGDFTAGNDLQDFRAISESDEAPAITELAVFEFLHAVVDCPLPMVAEVTGSAIGIGTTLLLHCDAVVASTDTTFALPFVPLGLVPEFASTALLPELVGPQRAARLLLLGDRFDAREGEALGLVSQVCEPAAVAAVADAWCRRIATLPREAVAETRALLRSPAQRARLHDVIDREARTFARRLRSEEHRQALAAFLGESSGGGRT